MLIIFIKKQYYLILAFLLIFIFIPYYNASTTEDFIYIGLVKYRGGDWYSVRKGLENFVKNLKEKDNFPISEKIDDVEFINLNFFNYPILFLNGHGEILFDDKEKTNLKLYLENGGTLIVNDDYGLDESFRDLIKEIFPDNKLIKLPNNHSVFNCYYNFPNGIPKIHEHSGEPSSLWGLYLDKRLSVFYIYSSDIADGWEKEEVHNDPANVREQAYRFGVNLIYYILTN